MSFRILHLLVTTIGLAGLTTASAQRPEAIVQEWLLVQRATLGLTERDITDMTVTASHTDRQMVTYVYLRQQAHGLPVHGSVANFAVRAGQVVAFGDRLQRDVQGRAENAAPRLSAEACLRAAALVLELGVPEVQVEQRHSAISLDLTSPIARGSIPARLVFQATTDGHIVLAWDLTIRSAVSANWWHVAVDASTGRIVRHNDYVTSCTHAPQAFSRPYSALPMLERPDMAEAGGGGARYRVFPFPTESPSHGAHVLVEDPADPVASPFGWHDVDGQPGAEYTITRGNNVYAGDDIDDDDMIGHSPDGGPALDFDFAYTPPQLPVDHLDASITNLFYVCNVLHDVWHHYGFDAASGNFQTLNYGDVGGLGSDEVQAQAQDGGGLNNANFATPPDGEPGRMQMYIFRTNSDSTLRIDAPAAIAGYYVNALAGFGPALPATPISAELVLVVDDLAPLNDGCDQLINSDAIAGRIALVDRGQCNFIAKVLALQEAGALAVIVANNTNGAPTVMGGMGGDDIHIPAVMISMADGQAFKQALAAGTVQGALMAAAMEDLRDSDMDNGIIAHEYGHGVSNRLTGGAQDTDCLWNDEQMGEGWSDWMGLMLTMRSGDLPDMGRGVGTFVRDEPTDGLGIRPARYSTDLAMNPYTYDDTNNPALTQPHGVGFVWATMLWDLSWALIDAYGFDPDMYTGTGGNNLAMHLVMDGLKLQPCNPGFVDGRNAILLADTLRTGGANSCMIWKAFAARGLGYSADQGSSFSRFDQMEAFDLPTACNTSIGISEQDNASAQLFRLYPNPAMDAVTLERPQHAQGNGMARILAADGRTVHTSGLPAGTARTTIALGQLAPAVYLVELRVGDRLWQERLVITR